MFPDLNFDWEKKPSGSRTTDELFPEFKLDSYVGITDRPLLKYEDPFSNDPFKSTI